MGDPLVYIKKHPPSKIFEAYVSLAKLNAYGNKVELSRTFLRKFK